MNHPIIINSQNEIKEYNILRKNQIEIIKEAKKQLLLGNFIS
jgi:hypothetical protein